MKSWITTAGAVALTVLGCLQMAGDLADWPELRAIGLASHASPAPKVFTSQQGFETFASGFALHWTDLAGKQHRLDLTPEVYARLHGPYNRRNAYGAAISYAPVLASNPRTRAMFESVSQYALCGQVPLLRELGIDPAAISGSVSVILTPKGSKPPAAHWPLQFSITCQQDNPA